MSELSGCRNSNHPYPISLLKHNMSYPWWSISTRRPLRPPVAVGREQSPNPCSLLVFHSCTAWLAIYTWVDMLEPTIARARGRNFSPILIPNVSFLHSLVAWFRNTFRYEPDKNVTEDEGREGSPPVALQQRVDRRHGAGHEMVGGFSLSVWSAR
jgi:hypothetical protein